MYIVYGIKVCGIILTDLIWNQRYTLCPQFYDVAKLLTFLEALRCAVSRKVYDFLLKV